MSLVRLEKVSKSLGGKPVLDAVSLRVEAGEKIGLIGRNGTGKTTVFRVMTGTLEPDSGAVERMRRARIAHLAQMADFGPHDTIFDVVMGSFTELLGLEKELTGLEQRLGDADRSLLERYGRLQEDFRARGGYEFRTSVKRVLHGLGFGADDFDLHVQALSGGQRTRLMLALVLLEDADLLLLDEPENHLDLEAHEWLECFLKESAKAVVVISHDRRLLKGVVDRIVEVERGRLISYTGNYENYAKQKALGRAQQQKAFDLQQRFIEKEQRWIDRFRYKNTKARQVQSRIKQLEKLERVEAPPSDGDTAQFRFGEVVRSGQLVLDAKGLGMAYGDLALYRELSFQVTRGERVGVIGPNGSGKTTLLRHVAGRLREGRGSLTLGHKVRLGFYEQHQESADHAGDVLSEIRRLRPDMSPEQVRTFMGGLLFTGDDVFKPLAALSGGELSRVAVAKLILSDANLLLLDEPTNHLDIASREAVEAALKAFPGTIVMVSHDRELLDRLVDKLVVVEGGEARVHLGNYSHYRSRNDCPPAQARPSGDALKIRRQTDARAKARQREDRRRRKRLEELEGRIESLEQLLDGFDERFLDLDPADHESARVLKQEQDGLKRDLQALYEAWDGLVEEVGG